MAHVPSLTGKFLASCISFNWFDQLSSTLHENFCIRHCTLPAKCIAKFVLNACLVHISLRDRSQNNHTTVFNLYSSTYTLHRTSSRSINWLSPWDGIVLRDEDFIRRFLCEPTQLPRSFSELHAFLTRVFKAAARRPHLRVLLAPPAPRWTVQSAQTSCLFLFIKLPFIYHTIL